MPKSGPWFDTYSSDLSRVRHRMGARLPRSLAIRKLLTLRRCSIRTCGGGAKQRLSTLKVLVISSEAKWAFVPCREMRKLPSCLNVIFVAKLAALSLIFYRQYRRNSRFGGRFGRFLAQQDNHNDQRGGIRQNDAPHHSHSRNIWWPESDYEVITLAAQLAKNMERGDSIAPQHDRCLRSPTR